MAELDTGFGYEKFGLRYNPFPRGEAEQYLNTPEKLNIVLFEDIKRRLKRYAESIKTSTVSFAVMGPWGTGKTLSLIYFYKLLRELYGKDEDTVKMIYIKAAKDVNELLKRIAEQLEVKIHKKRPELDEIISLIREKIYERSKNNKFTYIAIDQLEETYRNIIEQDPTKLAELAEVIRGRLSALVPSRYALGLAIIHTAWMDLVSRWPSLSGIEKISLRPLADYMEVSEFVSEYLSMARDEKLVKDNGLIEIVKERPYYPFTEDAILELYNLSAGVQRTLCEVASKALDKAAAEDIDTIDSILIRMSMDFKTYLRDRAIKEIYPFHHMRVPIVIREILAYISDKYYEQFKMFWIGPVNNSRDMFLIMLNDKNIVISCISKQNITQNDIIEKVIKPLKEGVYINGNKVTVDKVILLVVIPSSILYSRLMEASARILLAQHRGKVSIVFINSDSVDQWGRLVAFYLAIIGELKSYITSRNDEIEEIKDILKILHLT